MAPWIPVFAGMTFFGDLPGRGLRGFPLARERDIQVVLVAVPAPALLRLRNAQSYDTLASELGIPLENKALAHILSRDKLKADPIHPNADGYRLLAEHIMRVLIQSGAL